MEIETIREYVGLCADKYFSTKDIAERLNINKKVWEIVEKQVEDPNIKDGLLVYYQLRRGRE